MATEWVAVGKGIRYREPDSRKHGKRPDRYWTIVYKRDGKTYNEAVGWWSQGASQAQAEELLAQLRQNWRNGQGPQSGNAGGWADGPRGTSQRASTR